jgi:hypothetical protein
MGHLGGKGNDTGHEETEKGIQGALHGIHATPADPPATGENSGDSWVRSQGVFFFFFRAGDPGADGDAYA